MPRSSHRQDGPIALIDGSAGSVETGGPSTFGNSGAGSGAVSQDRGPASTAPAVPSAPALESMLEVSGHVPEQGLWLAGESSSETTSGTANSSPGTPGDRDEDACDPAGQLKCSPSQSLLALPPLFVDCATTIAATVSICSCALEEPALTAMNTSHGPTLPTRRCDGSEAVLGAHHLRLRTIRESTGMPLSGTRASVV